jgi:hypothetical protein
LQYVFTDLAYLAHVPPERMDDSDWDSLLHIEEKFLADGYREGVCACVVRMRVCFQANS